MASNEIIDWSRLAEPQTDQYDTDVILRLVSSTTSAGRLQPYRRIPVGDDPTVFDGQVAIRYVYGALPEFGTVLANYQDAPADHPNIWVAAELVRSWPVGFTQCQRLLEAIHPALDPRIAQDSTDIYRGSSCHSFERLFGTMWATVFCPFGLAEAIVHEMAHQKLRVLGVSFESASTIVGNNPTQLYVSPIIQDRRRPMTAVLHAEYSYVHVTELDIHMLQAERDPARREALIPVLERNLARIEEGYGEIRSFWHPGEHGHEFMEGFFVWIDKTVAAARAELRRTRIVLASLAPSAVAELHGAAHSKTAVAPRLPMINTSVNAIRAFDRQVDVLFTLNSPRIVLLGNVLSNEECEALIQYCEPRLERSAVVADAEGNVRVHETRTSRGVGLRRSETAIVARIEARLAALAQWPIERGEGLQVLRYDVAESYQNHFDWIDPELPGLRKHLDRGGQRLGTFVLYLSSVEAGGSTSFPAIGLDVIPKAGGAIFFLNTDQQQVPDRLTMHAGSPIVKGVKFVANKWLRQHEF